MSVGAEVGDSNNGEKIGHFNQFCFCYFSKNEYFCKNINLNNYKIFYEI